MLDNRERTRRAGILLVAGAVVWWAAALLPIGQVYTSPDPLIKLQAIAGNRVLWFIQTAIGFPLAVVLTTLGLARLATAWREPRARAAGVAGLVASGGALLAWAAVASNRINVLNHVDGLLRTYRAQPLVAGYDLNTPFFTLYTVATLASFALLGLALALAGVRRRIGSAVVLLSLLLLIVFLAAGDLPPLFSYLLTVIAGSALVTAPRSGVGGV